MALNLLPQGIALAANTPAEADCLNYILGSNEQFYCFEAGKLRPVAPPPETPDAYGDRNALIEERLARCQPGTLAMNHPLNDLFADEPTLFVTTNIHGWQADRCLVDYYIHLIAAPEQKVLYLACRYRSTTLNRMIESSAESTRTGEYSFNTADPEDRAMSEGIMADCELGNEAELQQLFEGSFPGSGE